MQVTIELPEDIAQQLAAGWHDLSRATLESLALEGYRARKLTTEQVRRLLGFESRYDLESFLKEHGVWIEHTAADLERERQTHKRLGL
jgi:Uncharacterised protein family (UPF0175)